MKKIIFSIFFMLSASFAFANTKPVPPLVVISLDKVSVISFLNFVYIDLLKKNFVIHPALINSPLQITVHLKTESTEPNIKKLVQDVLYDNDILVIEKRGYLYIAPKPSPKDQEPETSLFFYRAKYRPVSHIVEMTSSLFKVGTFSTQRAIRGESMQAIAAPSMQLGPTSAPAPASPSNAPTSPTSAQSLIDKNDQDSFIFQGTEKEIATLQKLLEQIDVAIPEVVVRGMVYEVTTGDKTTNAFSLALSILSGKIGINIGPTATAPNSITISSGSIDAVLGALSSDKRFQSVSSPSLRVKSGTSARFSVGSDVPVLGQAQLDRQGNVIQSIEYKPSGVIFSVQPQIRDAIIDLSISQQLSTFVATTTGVNNSPTLIKREISTTIGAASGDLIILGGLDEDKTSNDNTGLSFLPAWTRSTGHDSTRSQILLVLQVQRSGGT